MPQSTERSQDQVPQKQGDGYNSIGKAGSSNTNSQPSTQHNPLGGRVASGAITGCAPSPMCVPSHTFRGPAVWAAMCIFTHYYMQLHRNPETALTKNSQCVKPHSTHWEFFISLQTHYCAFGGAICGAAVTQRVPYMVKMPEWPHKSNTAASFKAPIAPHDLSSERMPPGAAGNEYRWPTGPAHGLWPAYI